MALQKCPRCELNYILDGGKLCSVCREEVHGKATEERAYLCSICGEKAPLPGHEMCAGCQADLRSVEMNTTSADDDEAAASVAGMESDGFDALEEVDDLEDYEDDEASMPEDEDAPRSPYRKAQ